MSADEWTARGIDVTQPSIARSYDHALGGKDNFEVDRVLNAKIDKILPEAGALAKVNRKALVRGVRFLAESGIRQFIDLGSGLPTMENTHEVAQRHAPDSRVVYVDNDPIVLAHGRALLSKDDRTIVVRADLRDPASVLTNPDVQSLIDFSQPVGILLVAVLHHVADEADPQGIVERYMSQVPSGSHLFASHFCALGDSTEELEQVFLEILGSGRFRTRKEIESYFAGLDMVEPGLVPAVLWRPDGPAPTELPTDEQMMLCGIGRKP